MKLLHVSSGEQYGGIETVLASLARHEALCPGLEQHFALCAGGRLSEELLALGAPVHQLGRVRLKNPLAVRRARRALRVLIERGGFDFVICHGPRSMAFFATAVRASGHPLVMWAHGYRAHRRWLNRLARRVPPDLLVCNSRFTEQSVAPRFPAAKRAVIRYPLTVETTGGGAENRLAVRRQIGAGPGDIVIVLVSRMVAWKGHRVLLDALPLLPPRSPWTCWIVGGAQTKAESRYAAGLESRARRAGLANRVSFLGQRDDVPQLLAAADIFCQPNLRPEPFGVVFVEALSAGLPVVTTDMGSAPEVLGREAGLRVPAGDARALADALRGLLEDPAARSRLGAAGPERARRLCDPATRLRELQAALESLQNASKP